jgi:glutamate/tyrosine decarboxylase-like PLP-dependent enzyme
MRHHSELALDAETMRRFGYLVVDRLVEWNAGLDDRPAAERCSRSELEARLARPPSERPSDFGELVDELLAEVVRYGQRTDHPRFVGYVPGAATWPAVLGDLIADGCNVFGGSWLGNAGTTVVELAVLDWFKRWTGYPAEGEGLLTGGGSEANLLAVLCARRAILGDDLTGAVAYVTEQAHASVERALRGAGVPDTQIRRLPVDRGYRMDADVLAATVAEDVAEGARPFLVVASAGTTNTGAVDPLQTLSEICAAHGLWLHVDAAYGGFFALTARGREALAGLERADSVTLDPHKGLAQPWGTGCVLTRGSAALTDTFHMYPSYLRDARERDDAVNLFDRGLQLTRPARAVKIWLSVRTLGVAPFRAALDAAIDHALFAESLLETDTRAELVTPASLGIVTFRRADGRDEEAARTYNASGDGHLSTTVIDGKVTLRLCINSFHTTREDVARIIEGLLAAPS